MKGRYGLIITVTFLVVFCAGLQIFLQNGGGWKREPPRDRSTTTVCVSRGNHILGSSDLQGRICGVYMAMEDQCLHLTFKAMGIQLPSGAYATEQWTTTIPVKTQRICITLDGPVQKPFKKFRMMYRSDKMGADCFLSVQDAPFQIDVTGTKIIITGSSGKLWLKEEIQTDQWSFVIEVPWKEI